MSRIGKLFGDGGVHVDRIKAPPGVSPDDPITGCCWGEVLDGPTGCTCWEPVHNVEQSDPAPQNDRPATVPQNQKCCHDCAYRNGSPEREAGQTEQLLDYAGDGRSRFFCHDGMRRVVAWRHPDGRELPETRPGAYDPPVDEREGVALRADGTLASLCGGWNAHRPKREKKP